MIKHLLKRAFWGVDAIPQWVALGLPYPQRLSTALLAPVMTRHSKKHAMDITDNMVVVSLKPLIVGVGMAARESARYIESRSPLAIIVQERDDAHRSLGQISLRVSGAIDLPQSSDSQFKLVLFGGTGATIHCLSWIGMQLYTAMEARRLRKPGGAFNFRMPLHDLLGLFVVYMCPRPVVLASVGWMGKHNILPLDLIGPIASGQFTIALRLTSPTVEAIEKSKRLALASIPSHFKDIAYELGTHHRLSAIDLEKLSFHTHTTPRFQLPYPAQATAVREVEVQAAHLIGSHMLFVTRTVTMDAFSTMDQLFHIPGLLDRYLRVSGRLAHIAHDMDRAA